MKLALWAVLCIGVTIGLCSLASCYKGDPGYGNVDYPPEQRAADSGRDGSK